MEEKSNIQNDTLQTEGGEKSPVVEEKKSWTYKLTHVGMASTGVA